jgi:chemotaxis protein CheX
VTAQPDAHVLVAPWKGETTLSASAEQFSLGECLAPLVRIVEEVFRTMLETEVATAIGELRIGGDTISALVDFAGAWQGTLAVQCSTAEALEIARLFMGAEGSEEIDAEIQDVMGELANIIAGNLKLVLPEGTHASLPSVTLGALDRSAEHKLPKIRVAFDLKDDVLSLTLTQKESSLLGRLS